MLGHFVTAIPAIVAADPSAHVAPEVAATDWLALLDQRRWSDSWITAGPLLQAHLSNDRWTAAVKSLRETIGVIRSRELRTVTVAQSLPGVPDGDYRIVEFTTDCTQKGPIRETVVLAQEGTSWVVNGYFVT